MVRRGAAVLGLVALLAAPGAAPALAVPPPAPGAPGAPGASGTVRLMAVGDVMLARSIGRRIRADGPGSVFAGVQDVLDEADLLVVNLECAITTSRDQEDKHYTFRAPPAAAKALAKAGVDVAGLANNHAMDWGEAGLADSMRLLAGSGIATPGAGTDRAAAHAPRILERNGLRVAFLAYVDAFAEAAGFNTKTWRAGPRTPGLAIADAAVIRRDVEAARGIADVVVVLIHAGYEYSPAPNAEQRAYAKAALDGGAALVLGHHPHVLQGSQRSEGRLVAWSLGNFVFDKMGGEASRSTILDVELTRDGVSSVRWIPVQLVDGLPQLASR
jgi:poly-gamma-glutamate capsule biosynthesis protein CapA/YwtB (metallophosphatase superfamily)